MVIIAILLIVIIAIFLLTWSPFRRRRAAAESLLRPGGKKHTTTYYLLLLLLPTNYYLLPTTYYLLPTTYLHIPIVECRPLLGALPLFRQGDPAERATVEKHFSTPCFFQNYCLKNSILGSGYSGMLSNSLSKGFFSDHTVDVLYVIST